MTTPSIAPLDLGALHRLKLTEPPVWLAPTAELSDAAREASRQLFSFLKSHTPKSPLDQLLVEGFDAEQIWQQIDLLSQPLLYGLKREVKKFEKNPDENGKIRKVLEGERKDFESEKEVVEKESDGFDDELDDGLDDDDDDDDDDDEEEEEEEEEEGEEPEPESDEEGSEEKEEKEIEDEFLKINELEQYLEEDEAREYGLKKDVNNDKKTGRRKVLDDEDEDEDGGGEEEEDEDEEDDELGVFGEGDEDDGDMDQLGTARYDEFFGGKKKKVPEKISKLVDGSEESSSDDEEEDDDDDEVMEDQKNENLSTHEKQLRKLRPEIEKMEKANMDQKAWTMQGEVTAAQRPKNSALEVDLDFQHNVRPAPVITEEFTTSLEEMIKKRILEGQFDDTQKIFTLPSKAPRELNELDESKSKKGLAEVYEEEFVRETNPAAAPLLFSDEQKKEASMLFKKLCLKLDALSHFHFTPKPFIEDMSIQMNVPALAMEEIAPIAVSDAAMLAPEEVFSGKGDVKEETELSQADRKRRRANKKRKFKAKAAERSAKRARDNTSLNHNDDKEE
ncbi:hypothetical protein LWI28_002044 [Acer negundo]|uniref:U3 small nucleolar ribonucleoprotein protein MPP10 n=1 Tax=Acer negundo TaxID=4023 RepID=A0AAD5I574_ACENE|nr:hypothetical protein LWI28_002044 [Acer negundo]KAK4834295.1 hypothetical protein QYF36_020412 [Acer negundo]